ncbi:MAG: SGNH/GDSL hydrolase family protein [Sphaerotilus sulfidivorans]|uniref:SGNH/GDSL hydrolase family protein n=1 Tax=Sphaerotilus sulfidivorans TaxID=639200 RepID=UPI003F370872
MRVLKSILVPAALAALLAACGGSERVEDYVPTKLVAFGDELSVINSDGSKHGVNALKTNSTELDCATYPVWPQAVASGYGLVFPQCNSSGVLTTSAEMKAVAGAKVADVVAAVQAYQGTTGFTRSTLVTLMAGQNDILAAYADWVAGTLTRTQATAQVAAAGKTLGTLVNTITASGNGGRVLYATPPDIGYSPFAASEVASAGSEDRRTMLRELTAAFVEALRLAVTNDGAHAALITADQLTVSMATNTNLSAYSLTNNTEAACTVAPLTSCTVATLVSGAASSGTTYLWADAKVPGPNWQARVGSAALSRARNNPF